MEPQSRRHFVKALAASGLGLMADFTFPGTTAFFYSFLPGVKAA
jgi:hypothetical protein